MTLRLTAEDGVADEASLICTREAAFLAGPDASFIADEALHINGGLYMAG